MWIDKLKINPLDFILESGNRSLDHWVKKDLLNQKYQNVKTLWEESEVIKHILKQNLNGSWIYKGNRPGDQYGENYELLQTWRVLRVLVEKYGLNREHKNAELAAEFIFFLSNG